ncbi:hypothetical protein DL95DRAFT_239324, partial [Leptodontidium sp. 2 PMI_412]
RFFMASNKYMGKGLQGTQPGDVVCSIPGCQYPLVLRSVPDRSTTGKNYFRVVGPCYVYGMMNGEVAKDVAAGKKTMQRIVL